MMKNIFKNIFKLVVIISLLSAAIFMPSFANAQGMAAFSSSGVFKIGNHANAGTTNWVSNLTNMHPGDQVQFLFTYLNTSSNTANSALSSYSVSNNGTSITVTGTIWASNAPQVTGSVTITAAPGYTISLQPTQVSSGGPGDVFPGPNNIAYHSTSVVTLTGNQTAQQPTVTMTASPNAVSSGGTSQIQWHSNNATECHATQGSGFYTGGATSGSLSSGALFNTTTYAVTCTNSTGSVNASVTVNVNTTSQLNCTLSANPHNGTSPLNVILTANATGGTAPYSYMFGFGDSQTQPYSAGNTAQHTYVSSGNRTLSPGVTVRDSNNTTCTASDTVTVSPAVIGGGAPSAQTLSATGVSQTSAILNGSVNPNGASTSYWFEYGTSQSLGNSTAFQSAGSGTNMQNVSAQLSFLTANTTYYFRVDAQNSYGTTQGSILSFTTQNGGGGNGSAPFVATNSATGVSQNSATLNGSVNSNGYSTSYWFEYGTTQSLGNSTAFQSAGSGTNNQNVSATLSGLNPNTTYYFRIDGQNSFGTSQGSILSFSTNTGGGGGGNAPTVQTLSATSISDTSAVVQGSVNPNGASTSYWFEYGTSQSLGNSTAFQSAGSGTNSQNYTASLSFLAQNTTYYYRIDAQNSYGTTQGSILSFTTTGGGGGNCSIPIVQTYSANNIYQNSAQLNGTVNSNNCQTTYWFEYGTNTSFGNNSGNQYAGSSNSSLSVSAYLSGLSYNTTYYFRLDAQNTAGTSYGQTMSFTTTNGNNGCYGYNCGYNGGGQPYVQTLSATNISGSSATFNGSVNPNSNGFDTAYAWFEYGTDMNNLNLTTYSQYVGSGNYSMNFSQQAFNLSSGLTYYFRAAARTSYGTAYGQILTINQQYYPTNVSSPQVITNAATGVGNTSALLNGQVDANGSNTSAWFEYGTTSSLGNQTSMQTIGSGNSYQNYSSAISGLSPNTTYYFRAAAQNSYGTNYGSVLSFTTSGGGTIVVPQNPVVIRTVATTNTSCVALIPSLNVSQLTPGQNFTLTITYRNGCTYNLSNVFLKVILPQGTDFVLTNYPFFNRDANGISYNLGAMPANFQSAISIEGTAGSSLNPGDSVIFSGVLNFNDEQGRFQSLSAYLTAVVGSGPALGATVLQAFGNLLGNWVFDLIMLFIIAFLVYWIFMRKQSPEKAEEDILEAKPMA